MLIYAHLIHRLNEERRIISLNSPITRLYDQLTANTGGDPWVRVLIFFELSSIRRFE